ncbi:hypothetical protein DPEC_G00134440 [Dallia pectoralis]|uniref:Uncharacterized protein n=1 Tax=Dallia pectoralis TaxID=75939 RepID=A0ACC2GRU0_DALPE|nr:hypothetical protein DPEC_G00134440 [Dallia pectoralis]
MDPDAWGSPVPSRALPLTVGLTQRPACRPAAPLFPVAFVHAGLCRRLVLQDARGGTVGAEYPGRQQLPGLGNSRGWAVVTRLQHSGYLGWACDGREPGRPE